MANVNLARAEEFWTDENIAQAVPKPKRGDNVTFKFRGDANTVEVPSCNEVPYQSVGILLFKCGNSNYFGTAYAVNANDRAKNVIFTAAHNLIDEDDGYSTHILFIPGFNRHTSSTPFCKFRQLNPEEPEKEMFIHPGAFSAAAAHQRIPDNFDLGAVKLQKSVYDEQDLGDVVQLLDIGEPPPSGQHIISEIGYFSPREETTMVKNEGEIVAQSAGIVTKRGVVGYGCSGGPWFRTADISQQHPRVIGTTVAGYKCTTSPYFSADLISAITDQL